MNFVNLNLVVLYTAKVRFFKQITTYVEWAYRPLWLFCIQQRYDFSSKSQHGFATNVTLFRCFVYRKGTIFQANHNFNDLCDYSEYVVLYTAKVRFFKQITTTVSPINPLTGLFCIPQRYDFSSKSQQSSWLCRCFFRCFVYRKGTIFQANHNYVQTYVSFPRVVLYTAKVRFFKQITTSLHGGS